MNRCTTHLTRLAVVALVAGGVPLAQVVSPAEIKDPKLRARLRIRIRQNLISPGSRYFRPTGGPSNLPLTERRRCFSLAELCRYKTTILQVSN